MTQGERVKEIRKALSLTLEKFGDKLGVQRAAVSKIERSERGLTDQMAKSICREYNVNYDWLINEEGDMFSNLPRTVLDELCKQYDLDSLDRALVEMYISFPESIRTYLKENLLKMLKNAEGNTIQPEQDQPAAVREPDWDNMTVEEAEAEYIKSRSMNAKKTGSSVSSSTAGRKIVNQ